MVKARVFLNKANKQLMIAIPKRQVPFLRNKKPKYVNLRLQEGDFKDG